MNHSPSTRDGFVRLDAAGPWSPSAIWILFEILVITILAVVAFYLLISGSTETQAFGLIAALYCFIGLIDFPRTCTLWHHHRLEQELFGCTDLSVSTPVKLGESLRVRLTQPVRQSIRLNLLECFLSYKETVHSEDHSTDNWRGGDHEHEILFASQRGLNNLRVSARSTILFEAEFVLPTEDVLKVERQRQIEADEKSWEQGGAVMNEQTRKCWWEISVAISLDDGFVFKPRFPLPIDGRDGNPAAGMSAS